MIIREFVPNDLKRVCEIEKMSFDESYELNMFKQLYDIGAGFLVAEDDGYVVGYVLFWIKYENEGHIISLAVDKDYQRKQAGTKLLLKAINVLSLFKINKILLEVNENNEELLNFIKNLILKWIEKFHIITITVMVLSLCICRLRFNAG